ncbi:MAG: tRNA (adenosine(37)-N6)-threonylcarbamoyltransferase complex ATPase subunit type 1 TsaE, partial [Planctomycetota bacterium]|nr:tRNA (adenosine(37)-N6)-threonylcarbamoyltransferase complex ATPase subunit type 1 TsaE [Planctomycetota bacterium]
MEKELETHSREETVEIGKEVVKAIGTGTIALYGELGSGKTVFVKGMASALGIKEEVVTSPTFKILNIYNGVKRLYHIDAYRLSSG